MLAEFLNILRIYGLEYFKKYYSCYEGIVEDNDDPKKLGRLRVSVPKVYGGNVSDWAAGKGISVGKESGIMVLPAKGDAVWVSFEGGDPRHPIWEWGWGFKGSTDNKVIKYNQGITLFAGTSVFTILNSGDITIQAEDGSKVILSKDELKVLADTINLGGAGTQPTLLGTDTVAFLNSVLTACAAITVPVLGVPTAITNSATFAALTPQLDALKSSTVKVK